MENNCTDEILSELQAENEKLKDQLKRVEIVIGNQAQQLWLVKKFWTQQARQIDKTFRTIVNMPKGQYVYHAGCHKVLKALKPIIRRIKSRDVSGQM